MGGGAGAGPPGLELNSPVAGMLMDRVTPLLQQAQVGEGIFLEGRVSELGGRARGDQGLLLHLEPH